jgi:hypothetical protein
VPPDRNLLIVAPGGLVFGGPAGSDGGLSSQPAADARAAFVADVDFHVHRIPSRVRPDVRFGVGATPHATTADRPFLRATGDASGSHALQFLEQGFELGYTSVCVIGSETPHLPAAFLLEAFGRLARHPTAAVLGPTEDLGCYLFGMHRACDRRGWVEAVHWNVPGSARSALLQAQAAGTTVTLLPPWYRIDGPAALARLQIDLRRGVSEAPGTEKTLRNPGAIAL